MRVTSISIELEKRVNDADYGSEKAVVGLSAGLEPGDDPVACLAALQEQARGSVESDLRRSVNLEVRRRMTPKPRLCNHCHEPLSDHDSYLHEACDAVERAERDQRRAAQDAHYAAERDERERLQLAGVGADDEDDEDDEDLPL